MTLSVVTAPDGSGDLGGAHAVLRDASAVVVAEFDVVSRNVTFTDQPLAVGTARGCQ